MTPSQDKLLIFTDLDGSLLDHHTYTHKPAAPMLEKLEELDIPVIAATSKTRAELDHIRAELNNHHPFIIENGAAVLIPVNYFKEQPYGTENIGGFWVKKFVHSRQYWLSLITHTSVGFNKFKTFSESTATDIVNMTGLDYEAAIRASRRHYGEPVLWLGNEEEKQQFINELEQLGAKILHGGRFMHISGECDKSIALRWLSEQYTQDRGVSHTTLAIGDSHNDVSMLEIADIALLIPSPSHELPEVNRVKNLHIAPMQGPSGWAEGVKNILIARNLLTQ